MHSLPVSARPDSYGYRVSRFVSRHKIPIAAASVSALALLTGAALAIWNSRAAALERDRAVAFAERNDAVTEFLGTIIREAAESPRWRTPATARKTAPRFSHSSVTNTSRWEIRSTPPSWRNAL
jgi:hypothetical protein